ncbi:hypothetical protein, variant [Phialophora macrospora]|uniref:C2H2-type domain-containing protein n=1 Tax=Phialophora macrospora TaxID=1851006 RepID=A0A0D2D3J2_9EURO|nr:hypothetical protein, variant [Phialophora macrospora]
MAEFSPDPQISPGHSTPASPTFVKPPISAKDSSKARATSRDDFEESSRPGKRPRLESPLITAAAALAEGQQKSTRSTPPPSTGTSPNPSQQALSALMGANQNATSKAELHSDAPIDPATTVSEPLAVVAENVQQPSASAAELSGTGENHALTSPTSISSIGTVGSLEGVAGHSGMTTTVGSPLPIEETVRQVVNAAGAGSSSPTDVAKTGALSYPTPFLQPTHPEGGRRGMSLPHSGTRQEKPYVCSTCSSRFRRLHDLKRHTKLHTGERPHICPKCGRKFARGDALARHNKGPGGCAGRRSSMGSFGGDEEGDADESMEGIMYDEPPNMDDEEGNERRPTPSIRRQAPSGDDTVDESEHASRIPSTYPPIQGRPPGGIAGSYFAPRPGYSQSSTGPSNAPVAAVAPFAPITGSSSSSRPSAAGSVFAQNPMTESPKPLSPGQTQRAGAVAGDGRNRSPSTTFYPQPHPRNTGSGSSLNVPPNAPQLPPPLAPHALNPPDPRYTLPSQGGPAHPPTQPSGPPTHMSGSGPLSSHSNSLSSHGHSGHGSGETSNPMFAHSDRIWAYVTNLEQRINSMQEEINSLKHQLANATQQQQQQQRT